jgi:ABC-2 type transport system ATP-binding protein
MSIIGKDYETTVSPLASLQSGLVTAAVEIDSLVVRYGPLVAVDRVTLSVERGHILGLLGPNGAGKTSLTETLLGLRRAAGGTCRVLGFDARRDSRSFTLVTGALLQRAGVWFPMSPREAIQLTASYYPSPRDPRELLGALRLLQCERTPWRRLSGGEQQRTLLALALVGNPAVLVLDEPTSSVDPEGHRDVRALLRAEADRGRAILLTTHQLADAEEICDEVAVIRSGRLLAHGPVGSLGARDAVTLETASPIDPGALGTRLGVPVEELGPRRYRVLASPTPALNAALAVALAEWGNDLVSLRSRATLEETYLELMGESS